MISFAALPNLLSGLRLAIAALLPVIFWIAPRPMADWIVLGLFSLAMVTDFLDGWLARRYRLESDFGRMLDPIADKAAVLVAVFLWAALWQIDRPGGALSIVAFPAAALILLRELIVSGLREHLGQAGSGAKLKVSALAKLKTALQAVGLCALFFDQALRAQRQAPCFDNPGFEQACRLAQADGALTAPALFLIWCAAAMTIWTGAEYVLAARKAMRSDGAEGTAR